MINKQNALIAFAMEAPNTLWTPRCKKNKHQNIQSVLFASSNQPAYSCRIKRSQQNWFDNSVEEWAYFRKYISKWIVGSEEAFIEKVIEKFHRGQRWMSKVWKYRCERNQDCHCVAHCDSKISLKMSNHVFFSSNWSQRQLLFDNWYFFPSISVDTHVIDWLNLLQFSKLQPLLQMRLMQTFSNVQQPLAGFSNPYSHISNRICSLSDFNESSNYSWNMQVAKNYFGCYRFFLPTIVTQISMLFLHANKTYAIHCSSAHIHPKW